LFFGNCFYENYKNYLSHPVSFSIRRKICTFLASIKTPFEVSEGRMKVRSKYLVGENKYLVGVISTIRGR
jgi:hypothetical protein